MAENETRSDRRTDGDVDPQATVDPRTIPPSDSNEALHIAQAKRVAAADASGSGPQAAAKARKEAAVAHAKQVEADRKDDEETEKDGGAARVDRAEQHARQQAPQGRSTKPTAKS
jgi:hypothetical protein